MEWLHLVSYFFGGAFLTNAVPDFVSGVRGERFQSPFAKPPGEGLSSSTVNVLWGFFNMTVAYLLICRVGSFEIKSTPDVAALGIGILATGLFSARNFGRLHGVICHKLNEGSRQNAICCSKEDPGWGAIQADCEIRLALKLRSAQLVPHSK